MHNSLEVSVFTSKFFCIPILLCRKHTLLWEGCDRDYPFPIQSENVGKNCEKCQNQVEIVKICAIKYHLLDFYYKIFWIKFSKIVKILVTLHIPTKPITGQKWICRIRISYFEYFFTNNKPFHGLPKQANKIYINSFTENPGPFSPSVVSPDQCITNRRLLRF